MSQHTPEPWGCNSIPSEIPGKAMAFSVVDLDGRLIADTVCSFYDLPQQDFNMNRLVACINACEGIRNPEPVAEIVRLVERFIESAEGPDAIRIFRQEFVKVIEAMEGKS